MKSIYTSTYILFLIDNIHLGLQIKSVTTCLRFDKLQTFDLKTLNFIVRKTEEKTPTTNNETYTKIF